MSSVREEILGELLPLQIYDPHSHVDPRAPVATHLADLLGYHYYTELAHASGLPKDQIEADGLDAKTKCENLVRHLATLDNTVQYSWLIDILQTHYGFTGDRFLPEDVESILASAEEAGARADRADEILDAARLKGVFLTNEFDEKLDDFDTNKYIPCLRTDTLVFQLDKLTTRDRVHEATGHDPRRIGAVRDALETLVRRFKQHGARACAISLPPTFRPERVSATRAATALDAVLTKGDAAAESHREKLSRFVFWTIAELCDEVGLPFDLMIGVNRNIYPAGVHQGRDLYDSRVSLTQYQSLFNAFPRVTFPVSVLASVTNQELVSHAWIFPNVVACGHWWYSNTPSLIDRDLSHRLEALPKSEIIGYYSDAYKLEFCAPKIDMFRRVLARVLARDFADERGWSVERCVELGKAVLRDNAEAVFGLEGQSPRRPPGPPADLAPLAAAIALPGEGADEDPDAFLLDTQGDDALDAEPRDATADSDGLAPEALDPEALDPEALDSDALDPELVNSEALDPEVQDSDGVDTEDDPRQMVFTPGSHEEPTDSPTMLSSADPLDLVPHAAGAGDPSSDEDAPNPRGDAELTADLDFSDEDAEWTESSPAEFARPDESSEKEFGPTGRRNDATHAALDGDLDQPATPPELPMSFDPLTPEGPLRPSAPPPRRPTSPPRRQDTSADDLFADLDEDDLFGSKPGKPDETS